MQNMWERPRNSGTLNAKLSTHTADVEGSTNTMGWGYRSKRGFQKVVDQNSEARNRARGMEHIGLTSNILWQVWKERNQKEFENKTSCSPARTIVKAQKEWLEQEEIMKGKTSLSTRETSSNLEEHYQGHDKEGTIMLDMATTSQHGQVSLGIGVTAIKHPNTRLAE